MKKAILLFSDDFKTKFGKAFDICEPFKAFVKSEVEATVIDDFGQKNIDAVLEQIKNQPYTLIAAVTDNLIWIADGIKIASNGKHFWPLDEWAKATQSRLVKNTI